MYTVLMDGVAIHDPSLNNSAHLIMDGVVMKQVNKADSFSFTIYPDNVGYPALELMTSWISVYKDGALIFHGRPLTEETGWDNEKKIVCEGDLAILNDTVVRPYSFSGTLGDYVRMIVNQHNAQVEAAKQITVRRIDMSTTSIIRRTGEYKSTMQELFEKIVDYFGGYILMEYESGQIYISYLTDSTSGTNQVLEIGKNILSFNRSISSEALATALIPLGATDDSTGERLTIKSVNGGSDFIASSEAATQGYYYAAYTFDDITDPNELLAKARALLTDLVRVSPRIELSAVDLSDAGYDIDSIGFFQYVTVQDTAHTVSGQYLITERVYNISAPEKDSVTFGSEEKTISGQTAKTQISVSSMTDAFINKAVEIVTYQTELLKGGSGGYFVIGTDTDGHPSEIYFMDTNSTATARSVLRINSAGIGFSTTGFEGPYTSAWTIDGQLHADFIKTGILSDQQGKNYWNLDTGEFHSQTLENAITANADGISLVSEKLNNIGGRNYAWAIDPSVHARAYLQNCTLTYNPDNNGEYRVVGGSGTNNQQAWYYGSGETGYAIPSELIGEKVIFHADHISATGASATPRAYMVFYDSSDTNVGEYYLEPGDLSKTFTVPTTAIRMTPLLRVRQSGALQDGEVLTVRGVKLERGEIATDWTPAPEDGQAQVTSVRNEVTVNTEGITLLSQKVNNIGGRNYLQYSNDTSTWSRYVPTHYDIASIYLYANMVSGRKYTVTIWGDAPTKNGNTGWYAVYWGGGYVALGTVVISNGKGSVTFTAPSSGQGITNAWIKIYNTPPYDEGSTRTANITAVKLEEGEVSTDWSAAPEDKTSNNEIIAKINVSPENITISANKVDLRGYVTFSNLSTSGQTSINGANITTGTISADRIGASSITAAKINLTDLFSQNITATNFNLTGGSINIVAASASTNVITLQNGDHHSSMQPVGFVYYNGSTGDRYELNRYGFYSYKDVSANSYALGYWSGASIVLGATNSAIQQAGSVYINGSQNKIRLSALGSDGSIRSYNGDYSKYSAAIWPDGNGAGRLMLGDGTDATWRTSLTNDGLTFRDASDTVTASYPATPTTMSYNTSVTAVTSRGSISSGGAYAWGSLIFVSLVFLASANASNSPQIATLPAALNDTALSAIDITSGIGSSIDSAVPCGVATTGKLYIKTITSGHIYAISGVYPHG